MSVRAFQGPGKWPIRGGGSNPTWSRNKRELYYGTSTTVGGAGQIMVVPFTMEGDLLRPGKPRLWSEGRYQSQGPNRMFDLHPDGTRFALAAPSK